LNAELEADDIVLVTFTVSIGNWKRSKAGDGPSSPKKKKEDGWEKVLSFNIQNAVLLYRSPVSEPSEETDNVIM